MTKRFRAAARFRYFKIPVETFTPPYLFSTVLLFHGAVDRPIGVPLGGDRPFIVQFFTLAKSQLHLDKRSFEIKGQRHERQSLLLDRAEQTHDLFFVQKQFAWPQGILVENIPMLIRADVHLL